MGFCLLNNIAIAARHAQRAHGIAQVLIVDFDVHHGNGTQDALYDDPSIMFISTHQSPLYPGTGMIGETGYGAGTGYTLNIPLPPGVGDSGYTTVFDHIVLPAARCFDPQLILVSAGFDAHWADPLANMRLSLAGFSALTRSLITLAQELCAGRIVFVLEGGYNLQVLSHGWANIARALLGQPDGDDPIGAASGHEPALTALLDRVRHVHKLD
jgi:acetoin utilization deacetylase AcuC-like enzyme